MNKVNHASFDYLKICKKCQQRLSKCGLTFFVIYLYCERINDRNLKTKIDSTYGVNSLKRRLSSFKNICKCGKNEIKTILNHILNYDSRLRENNKLGLSRIDIKNYAQKLYKELFS